MLLAEEIWTYVVVSERRCGASPVISGLNSQQRSVCHTELLSREEERRRDAHEQYFGKCKDPVKFPTWCTDYTNPCQYLTEVALRPEFGETSVGCYMSSDTVRKLDCYDLFAEETRKGGFSVILIRRNPVAAFVSATQATKSGIWYSLSSSRAEQKIPPAVRVDADELRRYCETEEITTMKLKAACTDFLEINYADILQHYGETMHRVMQHVEIPPSTSPIVSAYKRLPNLPLPERVKDWVTLKLEMPKHIRRLMDEEHLI